MCAYTHANHCVLVEVTQLVGISSLSTKWVPGIQIRSLDLVASPFTHWAILPALVLHGSISMAILHSLHFHMNLWLSLPIKTFLLLVCVCLLVGSRATSTFTHEPASQSWFIFFFSKRKRPSGLIRITLDFWINLGSYYLDNEEFSSVPTGIFFHLFSSSLLSLIVSVLSIDILRLFRFVSILLF